MTISFQRYSGPSGLLADEDVLTPLRHWHREGVASVLVSLIRVEGGAPRQPGAHMAVAADGRYAGYLSGGCLEQAVVEEAKAVIASGQNRIVRYGRGSHYFDIRLPCGSGLDLYFDRGISGAQIATMSELQRARRPFALKTDLADGVSSIHELPLAGGARAATMSPMSSGNVFSCPFMPPVRLMLLGAGPALVGLAKLAVAAGLELTLASADGPAQGHLAQAGLRMDTAHDLPGAVIETLDFASAAVLVFHAHELEPDLLERLLKTPCFYIGALGNHAVHRERLATLSARGMPDDVLARIRAPVGLIPGAKSTASLAVSVLAELMAAAKSQNLVP